MVEWCSVYFNQGYRRRQQHALNKKDTIQGGDADLGCGNVAAPSLIRASFRHVPAMPCCAVLQKDCWARHAAVSHNTTHHSQAEPPRPDLAFCSSQWTGVPTGGALVPTCVFPLNGFVQNMNPRTSADGNLKRSFVTRRLPSSTYFFFLLDVIACCVLALLLRKLDTTACVRTGPLPCAPPPPPPLASLCAISLAVSVSLPLAVSVSLSRAFFTCEAEAIQLAHEVYIEPVLVDDVRRPLVANQMPRLYLRGVGWFRWYTGGARAEGARRLGRYDIGCKQEKRVMEKQRRRRQQHQHEQQQQQQQRR